MKHGLIIAILSFAFQISFSQDTYSIVAVDPLTGEVGSAGATCLDSTIEGTSAVIISDIKPGKGVIHTQAWWHPDNQSNASLKMDEGLSPDSIISWLNANDAESTPQRRQYGIADFDEFGQPRVAAFTGTGTDWYRGDDLGPNYAVQGNILLGEEVLDSLAFNFFVTEGDLADKLMAAMEAAAIPGADTRCLLEGVSSRSAFIRVARPGDSSEYYLDIVVGQTPVGVEPVDVLKDRFDDWRADNPTPPPPSGIATHWPEGYNPKVLPNPAGSGSVLDLGNVDSKSESIKIELFDLRGQKIAETIWNGEPLGLDQFNLENGAYFFQMSNQNGSLSVVRFQWMP
jgi:uncharacterized Ntn-hydrolase superfamily protein